MGIDERDFYEFAGDFLSGEFLFGCAMASAEVGTPICRSAVSTEPFTFDRGLWHYRSRVFW